MEILQRTLSILNKVSKSKEFYNYFCNNKCENIWNQTWYFAKNEDTEKILKEIGFRNIQVFIEKKSSAIKKNTFFL